MQPMHRILAKRAVDASVFALALLVLTTFVCGCDRRAEPYVTPDQEPPREERPVTIPFIAPEGPGQAPPPPPQSARSNTDSSPQAIRGSIRLADGAESFPGVLFVIARKAAAGPPLAVIRLDTPTFPVEFSIGPSNVMAGGPDQFTGPISLTARLDADGTATAGPGDLLGAASGTVEPGATGVDIVLGGGGR